MDTLTVVDQYKLRQDATQNRTEMDPQRDAQVLSQLIKPFGREGRRIALVAQEDTEGLSAYQGAGFNTIAISGDRQNQLHTLINQMVTTIQRDKPRQVVLVTTDLAFEVLCVYADQESTNIAVWAPKATVPPALARSEYNYMPLEELLPHLKVARVDVRLDYESLHIGLERQGWRPDPKALIEAVKKESARLGKLIRIVAYADWDEIAKGGKRNIQRELALLGVETRYQVNLHGRNSADMKIADDIRSLVERDNSNSEAVDVIVLGTRDRGFRPVIETAKARGKRIIILTLKSSGLSRRISRVADAIYYLDDQLLLGQSENESSNVVAANGRHLKSCFISYSSVDEAFAERLYADLQVNGVQCWFAPEDMRIGDKIRPALDRSIRKHDKLLLILSKHSIYSPWVEKEVETAFEEERKREETVLFPIRLDDTVMKTDQAWAADIRRTRHIGDFRQWEEYVAYQRALERLLRDLGVNKYQAA